MSKRISSQSSLNFGCLTSPSVSSQSEISPFAVSQVRRSQSDISPDQWIRVWMVWQDAMMAGKEISGSSTHVYSKSQSQAI